MGLRGWDISGTSPKSYREGNWGVGKEMAWHASLWNDPSWDTRGRIESLSFLLPKSFVLYFPNLLSRRWCCTLHPFSSACSISPLPVPAVRSLRCCRGFCSGAESRGAKRDRLHGACKCQHKLLGWKKILQSGTWLL